MQSHKNKSSKRNIIIIVIGLASVIALVGLVGWLIVRVTHDQPQTTVYSTDNQKDGGNGLSSSGDGSDGSNGLSLGGLPLPGQTSASGSAGSAGGATSSGGSSSTSGSAAGSGSASGSSQQQQQQPSRSQTLPNGLKIDEYNPGSGTKTTKVGDTIAVHYVGYLPDGKVFDTSLKGAKTPFAFKLGAGQVIKGWDIGLQDMKVGAIRRLTIPAALAYGAKGAPPSIPPNTVLIFDTQLMGIQ